MSDDISPELMGIYNNGVRGAGGGGGGEGASVSFTLPQASTSAAGVVKTCNASSAEVTSETTSIVPTMWYVQNAIAQLTGGTYSVPDSGSQQTITVSAANTQSAGIVKTCIESSTLVTSETLDVVPTQYYLQSEVTRLEGLIANAGGTQQTSSAWINTSNLGGVASAAFSAGSSYVMEAAIGGHTITAITSGGMVYGPESHLVLYTGSLDDLTIQSPLVVSGSGLQANAMNACTLKFWNGAVYVLVDFYTPGFFVTVPNNAAGSCSLNYAITSAANTDVGFGANMNGSVCELENASAAISKTLTGNGKDMTIISGGLSLGADGTLTNMTLQDVTLSGTTAYVRDAAISACEASAAVVLGGSVNVTSLSGTGAVFVESGAHVYGPGTINLGKTHNVHQISTGTVEYTSMTMENSIAGNGNGGGIYITSGQTAVMNDCTISHCSAVNGVAAYITSHGSGVFARCTLANNSSGKGGIFLEANAYADFTSCTVGPNTTNQGGGLLNVQGAAIVNFTDCTLDGNIQLSAAGGKITFAGSNSLSSGYTKLNSATFFNIESGGTLNLTGNGGDNSGNVLSGGSGIVVGYYDDGVWTQGGTATVINSAGTAVTIEGSGTKLKKDGTLS